MMHCICTRRSESVLRIKLLLVLAVLSVSLTRADTTRDVRAFCTLPNNLNNHDLFGVLPVVRGGGGGKHDNDDQDDNESKDSKTRFFWDSMSDLFQLNNKVKEEASTTPVVKQEEEEGVLGRGGALVATTTAMPKKRRPVLDTSRVSTASSRLLHEEEEEHASAFDTQVEEGGETHHQDYEYERQTATIMETINDDNTAIVNDEQEDENDYYDAVEQDEEMEEEDMEEEEDDFFMDVDSDEEEEIEYYRDDTAAGAPVAQVVQELTLPAQHEDDHVTDDAAKLWFANEWWRMQLVTNFVQERKLEKQRLLEQYALEDDDEEDEWTFEEEMKQQKRLAEAEKAIVSQDGPVEKAIVPKDRPVQQEDSQFISSGYWGTIDRVVSLGLSSTHKELRLSRRLRAIRKATAHVTGLHGFVSGKTKAAPVLMDSDVTQDINDGDLLMVQRRIAAIDRARQLVEERVAQQQQAEVDVIAQNATRAGIFRVFRRRRGRGGQGREQKRSQENEKRPRLESMLVQELAMRKLEEEKAAAERKSRELEELKRRERVMEIDRLITRGQRDLVQLQCEKDELQRRPNPLYNYTTDGERTTREFSFPPQELVDEYLEELFSCGRLVKMNHTLLWKSGAGIDDDDDETIGDDLLTPSGDAHKLYQEVEERLDSVGNGGRRNGNGNGGGGSWLLRQTIGKGGSLGEKIGEAVETSGYKAVCGAVMAALARSISALHGINVMTHSDIRLFMEQSPDLPPVGKSLIPGSEDAENYAQAAIKNAMQRGSKKKRRSRSPRLSEEAFLQRDAVVETLISHCQISAPLLKLFPLAWQRGLLGNMITLIAAVVSDFADGIQLQILGHQLSFSFKPITERDLIAQLGMAGGYSYNSRRARPEQFEAAVRATAEDVSESLKFLDRWHERALGSGMLRAQIANLIARIVLTLADEVLSGARMDLWSAQAGGPRMVAALEYRTAPTPDTA